MVFDSAIRYWNDRSSQGGVATVGKPHIITTNLEHDSVDLCVRRHREEGHAGELLRAVECEQGTVRTSQ